MSKVFDTKWIGSKGKCLKKRKRVNGKFQFIWVPMHKCSGDEIVQAMRLNIRSN